VRAGAAAESEEIISGKKAQLGKPIPLDRKAVASVI
jgi:hypothetical protein